MTEALERRYRRLLSAYPGSYRRERGDEIVTTLLEMSAPDRRWPAPKEIAAIFVGAVRTHARVNPSRPAREVLAGGLRMAALFLLAQACSLAAIQTGFDLTRLTSTPIAETVSFIPATLLLAGALVSVASGRYWIACAAGLGAFAAEMAGSHGLRNGPAMLFLPGEQFFFPLAFALVACAALLVVRPPAGTGFAWLAAVPLAVVFLPNQFNPTGYIQPWASFVFVAACLLCSMVDSRIPIAGAAVCLPLATSLLYALWRGWFNQPEEYVYIWLPYACAAILLASVPLGRLVRRSRMPSAG